MLRDNQRPLLVNGWLNLCYRNESRLRDNGETQLFGQIAEEQERE
jgi:hypothetical protein